MIKKSQEQKWQAEEDARTMASYQEIMNDSNRMKRAIAVAKQTAESLSKRATIMKGVASTKVTGNTSRKGKK